MSEPEPTSHSATTRWLLAILAVASVAAGVLYVLSTREPDSVLVATSSQEVIDLRDKWGPTKFAAHDEETFIRDFFENRRDGFFLDVGASHYKKQNNTYFLEMELGWRGISIDAIDDFRAGYEKHRPNARYRTFFVSDKCGEDLPFYIVHNNEQRTQSSGQKWSTEGKTTTTIEVPSITLNDLLTYEKVDKVDFLNMDIEMGEPAALAGFDIGKYQPQLVCIEAHAEVREQLVEYFERHNYYRIELYSRNDLLNWYYTPRTVAESRGLIARDRALYRDAGPDPGAN